MSLSILSINSCNISEMRGDVIQAAGNVPPHDVGIRTLRLSPVGDVTVACVATGFALVVPAEYRSANAPCARVFFWFVETGVRLAALRLIIGRSARQDNVRKSRRPFIAYGLV